MRINFLHSWTDRIDRLGAALQTYLRSHASLLVMLSVIAIAAYGFELFQLNITIDEEMYATFTGPEVGWLVQGRWGMYLLNKYLFPYTVLPFVPLFVALVFHAIAMLLLLEAWGVTATPVQTLVAAIGLTFPGMAYMYTFSTLNFGIGIGLFCVALSVWLYAQQRGTRRFLAIIPAVFAIAIYQGLLPVLVSVFLTYLIALGIRTGRVEWREILTIGLIHVLSGGLYVLSQRLIMVVGNVRGSSYIAGLFSARFLLENSRLVLTRIASLVYRVYSGDASIYSIEITALGLLIVVAGVGVLANLWRSRLAPAHKIFMALLAALLLLVPFIAGVLMRGVISMRFLVALPVSLCGIVLLAWGDRPKLLRYLLLLLAGVCVFKFIVADNHLFAASHLALQEDRLTASRLILRIEDAIAESDTKNDLKYMEVIGHLDRRATELIPKLETFGASFFEIDQGNTMRVVFFLQTLGYQGLQPLPQEKRIEMVELANAMPSWPQKGSIVIVDETVLIKFGPYSPPQTSRICAAPNPASITVPGFCE